MGRFRARFRLQFEELETRRQLSVNGFGDELTFVRAASEVDDAVDVDDAGDSFITAAPLGVVEGTTVRQGRVGPSDLTDYFEFQLPDTSSVSVVLFGYQAGTKLALFNGQGGLIEAQTDEATGLRRLDRELLAGPYFVLIWNDSSISTSYQLAINSTPQSHVEPDGSKPDLGGDAFGRATQLGQLVTAVGFHDKVGGDDPTDVFLIEVTQSQEIVVQLDQLTANVDLHVISKSGEVMARSRNKSVTSEVVRVPLDPGQYFVLLFPVESISSDYRLQILPTFQLALPAPIVVPTVNAGDTFNRATDLGTLSSSWQRSEAIGEADSTDVFRFQLASAVTTHFELADLTADIDLYVFDSSYRLVGRQYRSGSTGEQFDVSLLPGLYYAIVIPHGEVASNYRLQIDSLAPAPPAPTSNLLPIPLPDVPDVGGDFLWNIDSINAPEAWSYGYAGKGIVVAVIDSGIDQYHGDLQNNIWRNSDELAGDGIDNDGNGFIDDVNGWNFVNDNNILADSTGHGTHVAGTLAATRNDIGTTGVAYLAKIMPLRVLDQNGDGRTSNVADAIRYAAENGADIVCLSLSSDGYSAAIYNALVYARERGLLIVAAAGNDGRAEPNYPARHSDALANVISAGAYDRSGEITGFSNRVGASGAVQVDAPGDSIYSTLPGNSYGTWRGTSMAVPHVAGVAALVWSASPKLTADQVRVAIVQMANRRIARSDSSGGLNAAASIPLVVNAHVTNPLPSQPEIAAPMPIVEHIAVHMANAAYSMPVVRQLSLDYTSSLARHSRKGLIVDGNRSFVAVYLVPLREQREAPVLTSDSHFVLSDAIVESPAAHCIGDEFRSVE